MPSLPATAAFRLAGTLGAVLSSGVANVTSSTGRLAAVRASREFSSTLSVDCGTSDTSSAPSPFTNGVTSYSTLELEAIAAASETGLAAVAGRVVHVTVDSDQAACVACTPGPSTVPFDPAVRISFAERTG